MVQMEKSRISTEGDMDKRKAIYRHNGFFGSAHMMKSQCRAILSSETATDESKQIANQILGLSMQLVKSLKIRKPFSENG